MDNTPVALVRQLIFCNCVSTASHNSVLVADALIFAIKKQTVKRAAKIATAYFLYNTEQTKLKIVINFINYGLLYHYHYIILLDSNHKYRTSYVFSILLCCLSGSGVE